MPVVRLMTPGPLAAMHTLGFCRSRLYTGRTALNKVSARTAKQPIILSGSGVIWSRAWDELKALVVFAQLLCGSQPASAQFAQQGPKLVGTGAVGVGGGALQGSSVLRRRGSRQQWSSTTPSRWPKRRTR
jgi:thiamine pyrophosphate-dependent acetolactate synthase large subunit-like protein